MKNYFFPIFFAPKRKIHSFQIGWDDDAERVAAYQRLLRLSNGFDHHLLLDYTDTVVVQIEEWYGWYNSAYGKSRGIITPHFLVYSKMMHMFRFWAQAKYWIKTHPKRTYIIGNEPDADLSEGHEANTMTESEYANFLYQSIQLIRGADPKAKIIMGAWAGGIAETPSFLHNENNMVILYNSRYGKLDVDSFSFHAYQHGSFNNAYPADKLRKFATFVNRWKSLGYTNKTDIYLTEFGWYGLDVANNTVANCKAFLDWYIPKLKANNQVKGWYWWEWGSGATLVRDGKATELGLYYAEIER